MDVAEIYIDTSTVDYNVDYLQQLWLSANAGRFEENETREALLKALPAEFDLYSEWFAENYDDRIAILESIASSLAERPGSEKTVVLYDIESHELVHRNIITAIRNNLPLVRSEVTLELAGRVAGMGVESQNIEEWARILADDISKGKD